MKINVAVSSFSGQKSSLPKGGKEPVNTRTEEVPEEASTLAKESIEADILTLEPPPGPPPKMVLKPLDLSPYTV